MTSAEELPLDINYAKVAEWLVGGFDTTSALFKLTHPEGADYLLMLGQWQMAVSKVFGRPSWLHKTESQTAP